MKAALIQLGHSAQKVNIAPGLGDAQELDDSAKWFADTDDHIEIYKNQLAEGNLQAKVSQRRSDDWAPIAVRTGTQCPQWLRYDRRTRRIH